MERSFGLLFYLKKSKGYSIGALPVFLRITVDKISCEISTKRKCEAIFWNQSSGRMQGKTDAAKELNAYLDTLQQKVFEAKRKLIETDKEISAAHIKELMMGSKKRHKHMLLEIFQYHNQQMEELVGHEYAPGTLERYKTAYKHTQSFLLSRYKLSDIEIHKLDFVFISEYEFWLKSVRKCDHNTTIKYLSNFRKIINRCLKNGWMQKDPFVGFNMSKREVERTALTESELHRLAEKVFAVERLNLVRDIFLFSCYTGLAYADVKKLKREEIVEGIDGEKWIMSRRQKTNITSKIPLLPFAISILDRYENHLMAARGNWVFPVLSNQKMNAYLKEIADLCAIDKNLTYHIARHTFATTITLSNGVPLETVSKMLGHRNLKTTQHYARILDQKISQDMQLLKSRLALKEMAEKNKNKFDDYSH